MALNDKELLQAYRMLHQVFPEDLHIARPLIQMLQQKQHYIQARELAMSMARRMLAAGKSACAIPFLTLCQQLNHPDQQEVEALTDMARFSIDNRETVTNEAHIFTLIDQLSDSEALDFINQGSLLRAVDGEYVVRQGESSKTFYLILDGRVNIRIKLADGSNKVVKSLTAGDFFGEFACVYKLRRSASVIAAEPVLLLEFSDESISELMRNSIMAGDYLMKTVQTRMVHAMTHSLPAFAQLPEEDRLWAAEESIVETYRKGELIAGSAESIPACHIVLSGSADLALPGGGHIRLGTGDMFGDVSSHLKLPAHSEVKAKEEALVCRMPENIFHSFMNVYASFENHIKQASRQLQK